MTRPCSLAITRLVAGNRLAGTDLALGIDSWRMTAYPSPTFSGSERGRRVEARQKVGEEWPTIWELSGRRSHGLSLEAPKHSSLKGEDDEKEGRTFDAPGIRPAEQHVVAQSQDDIAKQFVGMWRLVSWAERLADGTTRQNPRSVGYIICNYLHRYWSHVLCQHESESAPMEVRSRADTGRGSVWDHGPWCLLRHCRDSCERGICNPSRGDRENPQLCRQGSQAMVYVSRSESCVLADRYPGTHLARRRIDLDLGAGCEITHPKKHSSWFTAHPEVIHMSWKHATRGCAPDEREGRLGRIAPVKRRSMKMANPGPF